MKFSGDINIQGVIGTQSIRQELDIPDEILIQGYMTNVGNLYCIVNNNRFKYSKELDAYYTKDELKKLFSTIIRREKLKRISAHFS